MYQYRKGSTGVHSMYQREARADVHNPVLTHMFIKVCHHQQEEKRGNNDFYIVPQYGAIPVHQAT